MAFLDAMGLRSYVPRFVLPGAKASQPIAASRRAGLRAELSVARVPEQSIQALDLPVAGGAARPSSTGLAAADGKAAGLSPAAQLRAALDGETAAAKSPVPVRAATKPDPEPLADGDAEPTFAATLVGSSAGALFLCAGPDNALAPAAKRLLANIATAIARRRDASAGAATLQASPFAWPIRAPGVQRGASAARDGFTSAVLAQTERQGGTIVLCFAPSLASYLDSAQLSDAGLCLIHCCPPEQLLNDGAAKAALWRELRAALA